MQTVATGAAETHTVRRAVVHWQKQGWKNYFKLGQPALCNLSERDGFRFFSSLPLKKKQLWFKNKYPFSKDIISPEADDFQCVFNMLVPARTAFFGLLTLVSLNALALVWISTRWNISGVTF